MMVAVFAIKLLLWSLSTLASLAIVVIFKGLAYVLVLAFQGLRAPGLAINTMLEYTENGVRAVFEYLFQLLYDAVLSLISNGFDLLIDTVSGSISSTTSSVGELLGKTGEALEELHKVLPDVYEEVLKMVGKIVVHLLNNYKEAFVYVVQNL